MPSPGQTESYTLPLRAKECSRNKVALCCMCLDIGHMTSYNLLRNSKANHATSDDNSATDPRTGRASIAVSVLQAKIRRDNRVGEAPITEG